MHRIQDIFDNEAVNKI